MLIVEESVIKIDILPTKKNNQTIKTRAAVQD